MVRAPCCAKMGLKRGQWTAEEDKILTTYIQKCGHGNWRALPKQAGKTSLSLSLLTRNRILGIFTGLLRCGKSCRLRWTNYLRPDLKRGNFTREEEDTIIQLHEMLGNRWSAIAAKLPGRTDNEIKNVWHTHLKKRLKQETLPPNPSNTRTQEVDDKKQVRKLKDNPPQNKKSGDNPTQSPGSPQQTTSNLTRSSIDSSSLITCENRDLMGSATEDESMDSLASRLMQQAGASAEFWPEIMDSFLPETKKEDDFLFSALDTYCHPSLCPPFSVYQDDSMDFWLNVWMEAGQMQLQTEFLRDFAGIPSENYICDQGEY